MFYFFYFFVLLQQIAKKESWIRIGTKDIFHSNDDKNTKEGESRVTLKSEAH